MTILEGTRAPAFTLNDGEGKKVSLKEFRGKDVVVFFYPKDDTPGCTKEACGFRDLWDRFGERGAVVIGISPDDGDSHRKFAGKYELPFLLLSDPDRAVMTAYGAWGEKVLYGKRRMGVIRSTVWIGPEGEVVRRWKRVTDAAAHPARVLEALESA